MTELADQYIKIKYKQNCFLGCSYWVELICYDSISGSRDCKMWIFNI